MIATETRDARSAALDVRPIDHLLARILDEFRPLEIRLFGSRARGESSVSSDWDLLVVVPDTPNTLAYEAAHHGITIYER